MRGDQSDFFEAPEVSRFPPPREFQERAHRELRNGVVGGHQRQVLMAPTGAGKTYLGLRLCNEAIRRGGRALFVCDRKTLINQTSETADRYGMPPHGIIQANNPRMALFRPFQIASAQTLALRGFTDDFSVIVIDECHTLYKATTTLAETTRAAVIGLSATPFTQGLGNIYSRVVNAATMHELTGMGVLTPMRVMTCVRPDMEGAKTSGGEWTDGAAAERGMEIIGDVVAEWAKHADNRKSICFGATVAHAEAIVRQFATIGVEARLFTGQTTDQERRELLEEYRKPDSRIRVLVSVDALAKGFDVPDVACVLDARPLRKSFSTFIQLVGRGLRSAPGKTDCLLLDFSGNVVRFRDKLSDLYFHGLSELDAGEKLDREIHRDDGPDAEKKCPACGFSPMGRRCISCGFRARRLSMVEHQAGEARELDILGASPNAYAKDKAELWAMLATHFLGVAARRMEEGRPAGKPQGAAAHAFKRLMGAWPPRAWTVEAAPHVVPSRKLQGKLRSEAIAYARAKARSS